MHGYWKTKYGLRRVKQSPPTLEEAIFAATGLTANVQEQIEIAASLMDLPQDQVRPEVLKAAARRKDSTVAMTGRAGAQRSVIVERKTTRRPLMMRRPGP